VLVVLECLVRFESLSVFWYLGTLECFSSFQRALYVCVYVYVSSGTPVEV